MRGKLLVCLALAAVTLAAYWPVRQNDFVKFDDPAFVTENVDIKSGLSWHTFVWAFKTPVVANWHPLTNLSHALDCQLFGVNPRAHHLVSLGFHIANTLLLFLVLAQMSGAFWPSAAVAALFALHPLHVESVAWVSERKDVLSGFFFLLTLGAYTRYAETPRSPKPNSADRTSHPDRLAHSPSSILHPLLSSSYLLALAFFAFGLMSKPMLVTLPFLFLLLDYWPLRRFELTPAGIQGSRFKVQGSKFSSLLLEKLPFLALAAALSVVTFMVQRVSGAIQSWIPFEDRAANAIVSYLRYLGKLVWPTKLAVIYPYPTDQSASSHPWASWQIAIAILVLVAITVGCILQVRRRPYLAIGWFWFLGMMVPVIGFVQVGEQAMADRYTYLPLIGPLISLAWSLAEVAQRRAPAIATTFLSVILLGSCAVLTHRQVQFWRNHLTLFQHALDVTTDNSTAECAVGSALDKEGKTALAIEHFRRALQIDPNSFQAHYNFGQVLRKGEQWQAAADEFVSALRVRPNDIPVRLNLAWVLSCLGRNQEAAAMFDEVLRRDPNSTQALNNLAWMLATTRDAALRNGARAVQLAERACELSHYETTVMVGTLAAAYAEAGRFPEAISTAQRACALAAKSGPPELVKKNEELLNLYRAGQPCRQ